MKEVGTLKELDVKPGDVVEWPGMCEYVVQDDGVTVVCTETGLKLKDGINYYGAKFRIVSRASDKPKLSESEPRLWRDMTPEEKGSLLLAAHEGKVIQYKCCGLVWEDTIPTWYANFAYRIRPEPKIETVAIEPWEIATDVASGHRITFNTINGKPDCTSIKMEEL